MALDACTVMTLDMYAQRNKLAVEPDARTSTERDQQFEDESALLDCLRKGVDRCYEIFVARFGSVVLSTAKRYLRSEAEAADCFQDTFIAAFDSLDDFAQRSSLGGWLRGIAIKKSLMRLRAHQQKGGIDRSPATRVRPPR